MTKALNKRISEAFSVIYSKGDAGLEYMDGHEVLDEALMEFFYNDTVETLSKKDKERMAVMLEAIAGDIECGMAF